MDDFKSLSNRISVGECIAVVGAGGKTALCWMLTQALAQRGERVIFTTTTHIRQPAPGAFDELLVGDIASTTQALGASPNWHTACIAAGVDGTADDTPFPNSTMPVLHTKLRGYPPNELCALHESISNLQSPISLIVEADGARGLLLKAPAEYEPVIPDCATTVCVVANLQALGQPLDAKVAHRPERIAALTGTRLGDLITPEMIVRLLAHPQGGRKGISREAHSIAVLMLRTNEHHQDIARAIGANLVEEGFDNCIVMRQTPLSAIEVWQL